MSKINIKQVLDNYTSSIEVRSTAYYIEDKENIASVKDEENDGKTITYIKINDEHIDLFKYDNKDELEELYSWDVFDSFIILKEDVIKCFILNEGNLLKEKIFSKENPESLGFKIIIDSDEVKENPELFIANINKFMDLTNIKEKTNEYYEIYNKILKDKNLCIFEINNLKILEPQLKNFIMKNIVDFIRTNLVIINNDFNIRLSLFEFDKTPEKEREIRIRDNNTTLLKYPIYIEPLCFLESAQRMHLNHLKYIEYYHVLEYFISTQSLKNIDESVKKLLSSYLKGGNYEELRRTLNKISRNNAIFNSETDELLLDVLKQIDLSFIIKIIKDFELFTLLNHDIYKIDGSRLFNGDWVDTKEGRITNIKETEITKNHIDDFYKNLKYRLYHIRNVIVHSKARIKNEAELDFLPLPEFEKKLEEDIILIKEIAIELCRINCVKITE